MKWSRWSKVSTMAGTVAMAAVIGLSGEMAVSAQAPSQGGQSVDAQAFNACTTTDYASVAATALNTTSAALRKSLVSGQTLQQIAAAANIDLKTVSDAISAARKTEIDQAVTSGLLTEAEATALEAAPTALGAGGPGSGGRGNPGGQGGAPSANGTPTGNGGPGAGQNNGAPANGGQENPGGGPGAGGQGRVALPDINNIAALLGQASGKGQGGPGGGRGGGSTASFNLIKPYEIVAQALDMSCTDLVKTLVTPPGKSLLEVASSQNVESQTVITALTKAYNNALAQDVTDGVITQAQADQLNATLDKTVTAFVSNSLPTRQQVAPTPAA